MEFGRKGEITQDESGYFTQFGVHNGNPADMGFASVENRNLLTESGISKIAIAWRGKPPPGIRAKQSRPWFKKLMAFRAEIEGSISFLNRKFGLKRSMLRGDAGTAIWVGWVVIAANLYRFGRGP